MAQADFSRINSNIGALNALNSLRSVNKQMGIHQNRLATGRRINSAEDDPAGLTIANKFRTRNDGLKVAMNNIGDAKNLISVAEGGVTKVQDILIEMRNKAEAAASDTLGVDERSAIKAQLDDMAAEIDDIVGNTSWNGEKLLDGGTFASNITFQTGATTASEDRLGLSLSTNLGSESLGVGSAAASSVTAAADLLVNGLAGTVDGSEVTGISAGNAVFAGQKELETGTYKLTVTRDAANEVTFSLVNAKSGDAINVDQDDTAGGSLGTVATLADVTSDAAIDFGNGLQVTVSAADLAASESMEIQFDYTKGGTSFGGSVATAADARTSMDSIDTALETISGVLQTLGSTSGRLTFKEDTLATAQVNTEAAYNRIMNADMAMDQLESTKFQILQQTATSMLAQANQSPQGIMSLFR